MVTLTNISKHYREEGVETVALKDITLHVPRGEFVAIMGPSGSGKSTLLNIVGMLDKPTSGTYIFNSTDVTRLTESAMLQLRRGRIGFIFQNFNLLDELTVFENIELPLVYLREKPQERKAKVGAVMEQLKLQHRSKLFPRNLSGGQKQKTAIARAIVSNPDLILADEPTGNLDSSSGEEIIEILSRLHNNGSTIVMVTHAAQHAEKANSILNLFDGQLVSVLNSRAGKPVAHRVGL